MGGTPADQRAAGLAAHEAGRMAEAYRLLLPFAEAGDAEAQAHVGSLVANCLHLFESFEQLNAGTGPALDEATAFANRDAGAKFLEAASAAGIGPASFNLAGLYVAGYGGGSWEDRKTRAAELYALAYAQGFTAFGWLMQGEGPGQPYLDILEGYSAACGVPLPGEQRQTEPGGAGDSGQ